MFTGLPSFQGSREESSCSPAPEGHPHPLSHGPGLTPTCFPRHTSSPFPCDDTGPTRITQGNLPSSSHLTRSHRLCQTRQHSYRFWGLRPNILEEALFCRPQRLSKNNWEGETAVTSVRFFQLLQRGGPCCSAGEGEAGTRWGPSRRDAARVTPCAQGRGSA